METTPEYTPPMEGFVEPPDSPDFSRIDYRESEQTRIAWDLLTNGMAKGEETIDLSDACMPKSLLSDIYHGILDEDPRMWYVSGTCEYTTDSNGFVDEVYPRYMTNDWGKVSLMKDRYEEAMGNLLASIPPEEDEVGRIRSLHDSITEACSYNKECSNDPNGYDVTLDDNPYGAYAAIVQGRAVCRGYALAYKDACQRLGIECEVTRTHTHEWNKVRVDGNWYNVDLTFDDMENSSRSHYTLFMKSDEYLTRYDGLNTTSHPHAHAIPSGMECKDTLHDNTGSVSVSA